jgi:hypothetical protein
MGPTLGLYTQQKKKQFFDQICFFKNKNKILTILFKVNYVKITL